MKERPSRGAVCAALCCLSIVMVPGIICYAVGESYIAKYDPSARAREINAYSNAVNAWKASGFNSGSQQWAALGGFNVSVDLTVAAALTSTAIEPYAIETGADIPPYDDRAAYTTAGSTLFLGPTRLYAGGGNRNVDVVVRRADTGAVVASRTVPLVIEQTEPATRTCERDEDDNGGSSSTCTDSCSRGNLIGSTCYMYVYAAPTGGGICFALHPDTLAYVGGCAIMSEYAAAVVNGGGGGLLGSDVNKVGDVSYDLSDDPVSPLPDVPVVLRSSQDPWVVAAVHTSGYMRFGALNAQYAALGDSLRQAGIGLMVAPAVLFLCCCCCVACCALLDADEEKDLPKPARRPFSQHLSRRFGAVETRVNDTTRTSLRQISRSVRGGGAGGSSGKSPMSSEPGPACVASGDPTGTELQPKPAPAQPAPFRAVADARGPASTAGAPDEENPTGPANVGVPRAATVTATGATAPPTVSLVVTLPAGTDSIVLQPAPGVATAATGDASHGNNRQPPPYRPTPHTLVL